MSKIVLLESLGISQEELAARQAPLEAQGHTFVSYPRTTDPAALVEEARDADAVILANMPLPGSVIQACDKLKFIDVAFTGVDHIGLDAAKAKGIAVSNAAGYSNEGGGRAGAGDGPLAEPPPDRRGAALPHRRHQGRPGGL